MKTKTLGERYFLTVFFADFFVCGEVGLGLRRLTVSILFLIHFPSQLLPKQRWNLEHRKHPTCSVLWVRVTAVCDENSLRRWSSNGDRR